VVKLNKFDTGTTVLILFILLDYRLAMRKSNEEMYSWNSFSAMLL